MKTTTQERRAVVDKANTKLSIKKQCVLLGVHRSGYYYDCKPDDTLNRELMVAIDKEHTLHPFRGVPSMTEYLRKDLGYNVNKKRISRLYRTMDIYGIVPGPPYIKGVHQAQEVSVPAT